VKSDANATTELWTTGEQKSEGDNDDDDENMDEIDDGHTDKSDVKKMRS